MISMKRKKKKDGGKEVAMDMEESPYPYGLEVSLDEESMKKLGIGTMTVGSEVQFIAKAKVTSVSEYEHEGSKKSENMSLQITDMDIDMAHDSDVAKRFYGEDKDK